jgi:nucleoside transporter
MNTPAPLKARLCLMMFGQYFVQGSYLSIVSVYLRDTLGFNELQIGYISAALGVGPVLAPLVIGQLVDRWLPTERVLAGCHFLAALAMLAFYTQTGFTPVLLLATIYSALYVPTMMLTNTVAFRHLSDRDREFPLVRVCGTLGFIVPAWLIEFYFLNGLSLEALNRGYGIAFLVSGTAGLLMAAYCLTLPSTPPEPAVSGRYAPGVIFGLLRRRDFLILTLVTFVIAGAHTFYFVWNSPLLKNVLARVDAGGKVQTFATIGQIAEVAAMAVVGASIARFGYKRTMGIGLAAYALRCVALAAAGDGTFSPGMSVALAATGNALHGVCFGFFLAVAFMYVNKTSPPDVKGSMQTIYGTLIFGLGGVIGAKLAGDVGKHFRISPENAEAVYNWNGIWLTCAAVAAVCWLVFALAFPRKAGSET